MLRITLQRSIALAAALAIAWTGTATAQNERDTASQKRSQKRTERNAKTRDLDFNRKYRKGQTFQLTGKASMEISPRLRGSRRKPGTGDSSDNSSNETAKTKQREGAGNRRTKDSAKRQTRRTRSRTKSLNITGELEIVKVDKEGDPTELKFTVHRFETSGSVPKSARDAGAKASRSPDESASLEKGTVIIAKAGKDGPDLTVQNSDAQIADDIGKALRVILPIADMKKDEQSFTDAFSGREKRKQGESWDVKKEDTSKSHKTMGLLYTRATFVAERKLHGIDCAVVMFRSSAAPFQYGRKEKREKARERQRDSRRNSKKEATNERRNESDDATKSGSNKGKAGLTAVRGSAFVYLPFDKNMPPLRVGGTIAYLVRNQQGKATDRSADAKRERKEGRRRLSFIEYSFTRDLRPLNESSENGGVQKGTSRDSK